MVGYSPWGRKESDTTEQLHFHFLSTLLALTQAQCPLLPLGPQAGRTGGPLKDNIDPVKQECVHDAKPGFTVRGSQERLVGAVVGMLDLEGYARCARKRQRCGHKGSGAGVGGDGGEWGKGEPRVGLLGQHAKEGLST